MMLLLILFSCSSNREGLSVKIMFELSSSDIQADLASFTIMLYRNPPDELAFCAGWELAEPWSPAGGDYYDARSGTSLATEEERTFNFELPAERFGFTFVAVKADFDPSDPKDLARGCTTVDLVEGANPRLKLKIREIIWPEQPGVCGDAAVDGDEFCDDGNMVDDATCSADCLSFSAFQVNTVYDNSQLQPTISGGGGAYIIAWTSGGSEAAAENSQHVRARHVDLYGQPRSIGVFTTDIKLNVASTVQSQYRPDTALGSSRFMTLWLDNGPGTGVPSGDVVWRTLGIGTGVGNPEVTLNVDSRDGTQNWARLAGDGNSNFFAGWMSADSAPSHAVCARFDASGDSWSTEDSCSAAASDNESLVDVAMYSGGTAAVWVRDTDIFLQLFDSSGDRDGEEKRASSPGSGTCDYPAAAYDGTGRLLVVWRNQTGEGTMQIVGRLYDRTGNPVSTGDFRINSTDLTLGAGTANNPNYVPDVAGDPDQGMFIVVWDAPGEGGGRGRIVLDQEEFGVNRYEPDPMDGYFRSIDDFTITFAAYPSMDEFRVACAAANFCVAVWSDEGGDPDFDRRGIRGIAIPTLQPAEE